MECDTGEIIRKGHKRIPLWGVDPFEEGETAVNTRGFRSTKRRFDRRRERIRLLQEEFKEEMDKADPLFFERLKDSKYSESDLLNKKFILSEEDRLEIRNYYSNYPTIYHLRKDLIENATKKDIRLVYLAIHHMIKYRGNFLYNSSSFNVNDLNVSSKLKFVLDSIVNFIPNSELGEDYSELISLDDLTNALLNQSKNDIKVQVTNILKDVCNKKVIDEFIKALNGNKFDLKKFYADENLGEKDIKLDFSSSTFDDTYSEITPLLGEKIEVIDNLKELYDMLFLKRLFKGKENTSLSALMVQRYYEHKEDLKFLKDLFKDDRKTYNKLFRTYKDKELCWYDKYIHNKITLNDFQKEIDKHLPELLNNAADEVKSYWNSIELRYKNGDFLPRITDSENGKYPYQLNKDELIKIIENQGKYYPFLLSKVNNTYKIVKLLEFRIPYYVGPLNRSSRFAWVEKKINGEKITPYNFDDVIDKPLTAQMFIERMISHCTYILDEPALPNNSLLYSEYKLKNELKQIRVNGDKITLDLQNEIWNEFFKKTNGNLTDIKFKNYLRTLPDYKMFEGELNITGYSADGKFANTLKSYTDFFGIDGLFNNTSYTYDDAEEIIKWVTIFEDKDILESKIREKYSSLDDGRVKKILNLNYSGWGKFSKKLLTEIYYEDKKTGKKKNIMDLMNETEENFMQIINNKKYKFQDKIKEENFIQEKITLNYELVENLATSPATKRGIYQALKVVDEIIKIMGYNPVNISIEMARGDDTKGRKDDRKKYLLNLYQNAKDSIADYKKLVGELNSYEKIDSTKLFLYFIQEGRCLYSGEKLNIEDLDSYEVDHILPRSLIKDDSIDNKALVLKKCNQDKKNDLVLPIQYRTPQNITWWKSLQSKNLISASKFYRLTRKEYKPEDIERFINRQLVETRQITKHVANILSTLYEDTNIIYLKASLSHNYRERYELFKFRDLNNYHHAFDAYLAAVLGEYNEKYLKYGIEYDKFIELIQEFRNLNNKKLIYGFIINSLDEDANKLVIEKYNTFIDKETGEVLFDAKKFNRKIEETYYRNDILISRKTEIRTGEFYNQTIYSKRKASIGLKANMPANIYGGYKSVNCSYMTLVEFNGKRKLIGIPIHIDKLASQNNLIKDQFIKEHLKLKDNVEFKIIKDRIPFVTLINCDGQDVHIKGYSVANRDFELSNARELKIPKNLMKKWKFVLNIILNNKSVPMIEGNPVISEEDQLKIAREIINYLLEIRDNYPLLEKCFLKIKEKLDIDNLSFTDCSKVIIELLKIYNCSSANLKEFGLGEKIGRVRKNIFSGTFKFQSTTGYWEQDYEF